jgi:cation diffusion facilitator family transporter
MDHVRRVDRDNVPQHIAATYRWASAIAVVGNLLLLGSKAWVARESGSSAVFADAANSASDVAYSVLMTVGLWLSLQPPDARHPHGHQRIESLVSLSIGMLMTLAGYESVRASLATLRGGPRLITSIWALAVLGFTGLLKGAMYLSVARLARRARSTALRASARDNLNDLVSSAMAFVGILVNRLGWRAGDPVAALLVSVWIFRSVWLVLSESLGQLIGQAASPEVIARVEAAICTVPDVLAIDKVIVEQVGPSVRADIHVYMRSELMLDDIHRASHAVRAAVEALPEVEHAFVHVEPYWRRGQPPDAVKE